AQLCRGNRQHGTQPLAAGCDQMVGKAGNQLDVGNRLIEDDAVDRLHVGGDDVEQRPQALCGISRLFERDDNTHLCYPRLTVCRAGITRSDEGQQARCPPRRASACRVHLSPGEGACSKCSAATMPCCSATPNRCSGRSALPVSSPISTSASWKARS